LKLCLKNCKKVHIFYVYCATENSVKSILSSHKANQQLKKAAVVDEIVKKSEEKENLELFLHFTNNKMAK